MNSVVARPPSRVPRSGAVVAVAICLAAVGYRFNNAPAVAYAPQLPTELPSTKFSSGQNIAPYFEGWIRNADGSFDLVFGYFNRNWQEELAIPAGPENVVEPGPAERGPPRYCLPRPHRWGFGFRGPKDFGKQAVTG